MSAFSACLAPEWEVLSQDLTVILADPDRFGSSQIDRWRNLSSGIQRFVDSMAEPVGDAPELASLARLSERQRQVMELVVAGRANKAIAHLLNISQRTAENHRAVVMKKTGARTLPDLVRLAYKAQRPQYSAGASTLQNAPI